MICPYCGSDNNDSAKFCKKCGKSLSPVSTTKKEFIDSHENVNSVSTDSVNSSNGNSSKNLVIICVTVIICTALIVGSVLIISSNNDNTNNSNIDSSTNVSSDSINKSNSDDKHETSTQKTSTTNQETSTPSTITHVDWVEFYLDGNPNTGADATIFVGSEYSGEQVEVCMDYSRDGNYFRSEGYHGYTVNNDGTIFVRTTAPLNKYPDKCEISLTHNGNTLSLTCPMKKHKGTQRVTL